MKFSVGDRVYAEDIHLDSGIGTVVEYRERDPEGYFVVLDYNGDRIFFYPEEVRILTPLEKLL